MLIERIELDALRIAAWCKDIPVNAPEALTADGIDTLLEQGYLWMNKAGTSYRVTERGKRLLKETGYEYPGDKKWLGKGHKLERRLRMAKIVLFLYRLGADVFLTQPASAGLGYLPAFHLRRQGKEQGKDLLGGTTFAGILYANTRIFILYYVVENTGLYPDAEERIFTAPSISLGKDIYIVFTGKRCLPELAQLIEQPYAAGKKSNKAGFREAAGRFTPPVCLVPFSDGGIRQLRIMAQTDYRRNVAMLMLGVEYVPAGTETPCDARYKSSGEPFIVALDMNLNRLEQAIGNSRNATLHVLALEYQAAFLQRRLTGKRVRLHTVPAADLERALSLPECLHCPAGQPYVTKEVVSLPRLSELIQRLEKRVEAQYRKHKENIPRAAVLAGLCLYGYGMLVNMVTRGLGRENGAFIEWNPFANIKAVFSPAGLGLAFISLILFCLFTQKGKSLISGYRTKKDKERGLEILPEGTHGTSGWMDKQTFAPSLKKGNLDALDMTLLGKLPDTGEYVGFDPQSGMSKNIMVYGAPGTGKSRGVISPFIMQAVRRSESLILVDPKAEFFEQYSEFLKNKEYEVRSFNLLDLIAGDGWNCLSSARLCGQNSADTESNVDLVAAVAEIIIKNTSNDNDRKDFWENSEKSLLMALIHYILSLTGPDNELLPIEERSLGAIYKLLATTNMFDLENRFNELRKKNPQHPALAPFGIFKQAHKQIWGNIIIGLGSRLSVFQNTLIDSITRYDEIDLELPGKRKCAYFCIISDSDSSLEFLSSLFFSLLFIKLSELARVQEGRRLQVPVNVLMDELCNCGKLLDYKKVLSVSRSKAINILSVTQSIAQLAERYPKTEWQELVGNCDLQIFLGCNDIMTAEFISKQCGDMTVRVNNSVIPMPPLLSPFLQATRPYTHNKTSTGRALLLPDEVRRFPQDEALILIRGERPLKLKKITPEELPAFQELRHVKANEHIPAWRRLQEEAISDGFIEHEDFDEIVIPEPPAQKTRQKRTASKRNTGSAAESSMQITLFSTDHQPMAPASGGIDLTAPITEVDAADI